MTSVSAVHVEPTKQTLTEEFTGELEEQTNNNNNNKSNPPPSVPAGSPSRGGDAAVYVFDLNQPSLPTPFCSVIMSVSVFMALSTIFNFKNSPDNFLLSRSVLISALLVLLNYVSLYESLPQP